MKYPITWLKSNQGWIAILSLFKTGDWFKLVAFPSVIGNLKFAGIKNRITPATPKKKIKRSGLILVNLSIPSPATPG
jgi:hypothetical protein